MKRHTHIAVDVALVADHDPAAFVVVYPLSDIHGGVIKKAALH